MTDSKITYLVLNNKEFGFIKITKKFQEKPIILKTNNIPTYCYYGNIITKINDIDLFFEYIGIENKNELNIICENCKKNHCVYSYYEKETDKVFFTIGCPYCEIIDNEINCYNYIKIIN